MRRTHRIARTVAAFLTIAALAVPSVAAAQQAPDVPPPDVPAQGPRKGKKGKKAKRKHQFPMKAKRFAALVNQRLKRVEARLNRVLQKRNVPPEIQQKVKARFAKAKAKIQDAVQKAGADGTVTRQEARRVRQLARQMKQQARKALGKKGKKGKKGKRRGGQGKR